MKMLAIDAGNTRVKVGVFDGDCLVRREAVATRDVAEAQSLGRWLAHACEEQDVETLFLASVIRGFSDVAKASAEEAGLPPVVAVTPSMKLGIVPGVPQPETVGIDRLVAAGEAHTRTEAATVLVTLGTAVTIDFVTKEGRFTGGTITPGLATGARALSESTSLLPEVDVEGSHVEPPVTTEDSIRMGALIGTAGAIERIASQTWAGDGLQLILSGGDAALIEPFLTRPYERMDDLVLHGLASICARESG